jgi:hypothetical protein
MNLSIDETPINCARVALARADAHDLRELEYEDLAITDLSGARRFLNRLDDLIDERIRYGDFDFRFRHELDRVFGAAIDLRVSALAAEAAHFGHGHTLHSDVADGLAHLVQLERLDHRGHELHELALPLLGRVRPEAPDVPGRRTLVPIMQLRR